jgi:hypothetical protein
VTHGVWERIRTAPGNGRSVWVQVEAYVDPAAYRPRLADDIEIKEFRLRWGNDYVMLANPRDLIHYRLDPGELETVRLMDGSRTVQEIVVDRFRDSVDLELEGVAELVRQLRLGGFLASPFVDAYGPIREGGRRSTLAGKAREFATTLRVEWSGADRFFRWLYDRGFRVFFNRWVAAVGLVFVGVSINLDTIMSNPTYGLVGRALEALVLLVAVLIVTMLLLVPAQGMVLAGAELLAVGVVDWAAVVTIQVLVLRNWRSLEPAFGYYSKPPLIAWAIGLTTSLCGHGEPCVRLASPLFYTATPVFIYLAAARLYDARIGFWAPLVSATPPGLSSLLSRTPYAGWTQPEAPGKWSIGDVLHHLADAELVWGWRLRRLLTEERIEALRRIVAEADESGISDKSIEDIKRDAERLARQRGWL